MHIHLYIFTSIFFIHIDIDMYFYIYRFVPQSWGTVISLYKYKRNSLSLQKSYPFTLRHFLLLMFLKKIQLRFLNPWERIYKLKHSTGLVAGVEDCASACRLPSVIELARVTGQELFKLRLHTLVLPSFITERSM